MHNELPGGTKFASTFVPSLGLTFPASPAYCFQMVCADFLAGAKLGD